MSVVVVFLGQPLWTWIWGAWGTLLAVPMLVVITSIAEDVESLQPVSRLIGAVPTASPARWAAGEHGSSCHKIGADRRTRKAQA